MISHHCCFVVPVHKSPCVYYSLLAPQYNSWMILHLRTFLQIKKIQEHNFIWLKVSIFLNTVSLRNSLVLKCNTFVKNCEKKTAYQICLEKNYFIRRTSSRPPIWMKIGSKSSLHLHHQLVKTSTEPVSYWGQNLSK